MIDNKTSKMFRGIAILMVMASHFSNWMYTESAFESWRVWLGTFGVYGVDIFFLLSGYGLVKAYEKGGINKRFVVRRFLNSYLPYILIVGFCTIVIDKGLDSPKAVYQLLIGHDFWYMNVLFVVYIMFMVFYKIGFCKEILLTIGIIGYSYWLSTTDRPTFWVVSNGAFLVGVYAATLEKKLGSRVKDFIVRSNFTMIAFALMVASAFWHAQSGTLGAHVVSSMLFTVMALSMCVQFQGVGYILPILGQYSLYIYLIHARLFWQVSARFGELDYFKVAVIGGIVGIVAGIALGYCMETIIKFVSKKVEKKQ